MELGDFGPIEYAKRPKRLPTVLTKAEVGRVLGQLSGTHALMAQILYGCGLRLMECVRLQVKDIDFGQNQIMVRDGKGMKDRSTMLPEQFKSSLAEQLRQVRFLYERD